MRTRRHTRARYARASGRTPHARTFLASLAAVAVVAALSVPLATAALAGDGLTDTSTLDDTTTDLASEPTDEASPLPSPSEVVTTVEETAEELEATVSDTSATLTGEPSDEPSPSPSPSPGSEEPPEDPTEEPTQDPAGTDQSDSSGSGDTDAESERDQPGTSGATDGNEGRTGSTTSDDRSDELAAYADSDPEQRFVANDATSARLVRIAEALGGTPGQGDPPAAHPGGGSAGLGHVPAYLLADPYAGASAHDADGPRSTVDILRRLQAIGAGPAEIVGVLLPFPVMGPASYSDDWHAPRDGGARLHKGTDVFAPRGTPVVAVASGTITRISPSGGLGGRTVHLTTDDGTYFYYAHLDAFHVRLTEGQRVTAGSLLGFVGNTGNAITTPPHLHFEIHPGGGAATPPLPQLDRWLADARARLAEFEAQAAGQPHAGGEALTPLVAPPAWAGDETNWSQGEAAGAGMAAGAAEGGQSAGPISHAAAPTSFSGQRTLDRRAVWALVLAVMGMFGLQRLLSRQPRELEPARVDDDRFFDEELRELLSAYRHSEDPGPLVAATRER